MHEQFKHKNETILMTIIQSQTIEYEQQNPQQVSSSTNACNL